ncbi:enoyl-CoA hydratase/isomerase family protein [bacterium]|nr:enoyl-CoA hydratase/isomerase family protein [bacterium]
MHENTEAIAKPHYERKDKFIYLYLGSPQDRVVTLSSQYMSSLEKIVSEISTISDIAGLLILGPTPEHFCAGANIHEIKTVTEINLAQKLGAYGQGVIDKFSKLPFPTAAVIGGPCAGGAFELALACDYRLAFDLPQTKIGLPEIKLGIFPGFGGSQRLPRLIGLPRALEVILKGDLYSADRARKYGLVDAVIRPRSKEESAQAYEQLLKIAKDFMAKRSRQALPLKTKFFTFTSLGRNLVRKQVESNLLKTTRGFYPAPIKALETVISGLGVSLEQGLKQEIKAVAELVISPESKSLIHVFLLTEESAKRWKKAQELVTNEPLGVVGCGVMGLGIAASYLLKGYRVLVFDALEQARKSAQARVQTIVERRLKGREAQVPEVMSRLMVVEKIADLSKVQIVVEAVVEDYKIKQELLRSLSAVMDDTAVIASNTSSLPISALAQGVLKPERVIGMHFFNPAEKMPLVEVVAPQSTNNRTIALTAALATKIGKQVVVVEEVPGFLVNRVLAPYLVEAATLLSQGFSIEDIDHAALSFGLPMGPLRLLDEIGLDVAQHVAKILSDSYGERFVGPDYSAKLVAQGKLGKKNASGFYRYTDGERAEPDGGVYTTLGLGPRKQSSLADRQQIQDRLVYALIAESIRAYEEGVAGAPSSDAQGQIDLASVMGFGFPPFRGGIFYYINKLGEDNVRKKLSDLAAQFGARFSLDVKLNEVNATGAASLETPATS